MTQDEIKNRIAEELKAGRVKLVHQRHCIQGDIDGLRRILKETNADFLQVIPRPSMGFDFQGCDEYFYILDNREIGDEAQKLMKSATGLDP